jgi:peptide/nickel transport system permease protein
MMRRAGWVVIACLVFGALAASWVSPHDPWTQFGDRTYAPPMRVHVRDTHGWHAPFVYRQVLVDRVSRQFADDTSRRVPLRWFREGRLASVDPADGPLLWLGADGLGRDVWSRLWHGARLSLGVALAGALGALLIGACLGALAGALRGMADLAITGLADFVIVLPAVYLVLVLRSAIPLVLDPPAVFGVLTVLFAIAGWPHVARGVRAIVATERRREYAEAALAAGAGPLRLLRHLVPASFGFLRTELVLLVPALLVAESTISFLGLGFPEPVPSWGLMLKEASSVSAMQLAPWTMAPALLLFVGVLALQQVAGGRSVDTIAPRR